MTDLIEIIPSLSDIASVPLVVVALVWLVNRVFDRQQEATMIHNDQINKLIGVMSEQGIKLAELMAVSQEQSSRLGEMTSGINEVRHNVDSILDEQRKKD